jgi:CHAT domain-containing protein
LAGLEAEPAAQASAGPRSALLDSLQSALGDEIAGGGFADFATLRRLAFESNALWLFSAAERQFADAVRMHAALWPRDYAGRADLQTERALNLANQRRFAEAEKVLAEARTNAERGNDAYVAAKTAAYAALVSLNAGELETAGQRAREARQRIGEWRRRGDGASGGADAATNVIPVASRVAMLEAQMARTEAAVVRKRDPAAARAALESAVQQAARLEKRSGAWLHAAIAQDLAALDLSSGRPAEAVRGLRAALADYRGVAARTRIEANLLMDLGEAERAAGDRDAALTHFREAFAIYREQPENRGVGPERAMLFLAALSEGGASGDELFDAFETVASPAVAQTAAATAARLQAGEGGESIRAWQDGDRALRRALARQASLTPDAPLAEREAAEADVARLRARTGELKRALDARFPNFGVVTLQPVALKELQEALGPGERVVRIAIGAGSGVGLLIDRERVQAFPIALGESEVTTLVNRIKSTVRNPEAEFDTAASRKLFDGLFGAVRGELLQEGGGSRLVIESTGALASLPFGILLTGAGEGADAPWLARRVALISAPSMRAFVLARQAAPSAGARPFVGFGDFSPITRLDASARSALVQKVVLARRLPPQCVEALDKALARMQALPGTARELETVQRTMGAGGDALVMRQAFTDGGVLQSADVRDARVLMFSTHGFFAADFPDAQGCLPDAALLTSAVAGGDGAFLDSAQVLDLKLDADLVVLSACDTGNPQAVAPGETGLPSGGDALSGLARSFFYAGARSVLISHWVLPDEDTVAVMAAFFERIAAGVPAPEALQAAQMAQIAAGASDPLQWAAFAVVGAPPPVNAVSTAAVQPSALN